MWFGTKNLTTQISYVETEPDGPVYRDQKDGSVWYPCSFDRDAEGHNLVVSYEVTGYGELLYRVVDGERDALPVGRPKTMPMSEFINTHEQVLR